MKAKTSLRAMLWPLLKQFTNIKYRLSNSRKPQTQRNPFNMDLQKVAADGKRIAEKMQAMQLLAEQSKLQNKSPSDPSPAKDSNNTDPGNDRLHYGWREDEDDRHGGTKDHSTFYRQNRMGDENPEIMKAILHTFFRADHDAAQFEQYLMENNRGEAVTFRKPGNPVKRFLNAGLKVLLTLTLTSALYTQVKAQEFEMEEYEEPKTYTVGDRTPDVTIDNLLNSEKKGINLSDYKGKLLIIDFWATWCDFSTSLFNKEDSLERKFNGKVAFLPVSYQSREEINRFLTTLRKNSPASLPAKQITVATGDNVLRRMFPHVTLPHFVWIGQDGIVKAITGFEDLNEANISKVLSEQPLNVRIKKEIRIPYDPEKPILLANNGGDGSNMFYHSVFTKYTEGLGGAGRFYKNDPVKGGKITISNFNVANLYKFALGNGSLNFAENRVVYEVKDPNRLNSFKTGGEYDNWLKQDNGFCYELIVPPPISGRLFKLMLQDLDRVFPQYEVKLEKRNTKCLALVRTSKVDKLKSGNGKPELRVDDFELSLTNGGLHNLVDPLNAFYLQSNPLPVIDDTGYSGPVDLQIKASLKDVTALNRELAKYDLKFIETEKVIDIMVFRDRKI